MVYANRIDFPDSTLIAVGSSFNKRNVTKIEVYHDEYEDHSEMTIVPYHGDDQLGKVWNCPCIVSYVFADKQEPPDIGEPDDLSFLRKADKQKDAKSESQIRQQIAADVKAELESLCEEWIFTTLELIILYPGKNLFSTDKQEGKNAIKI